MSIQPCKPRSLCAAATAVMLVTITVGTSHAQTSTRAERNAMVRARRASAIARRAERQTGVRPLKTTKATAHTAKAAKAAKVDPVGPFQKALNQLDLTPDERTRIAAADQKTDTDSKVAYDDRKLTPDQYQARMAQINADHRKAVEDALTPEHKTRLQSLLGEGKATP